MDLAIMLEGQNGLTWERWQRIATAVDELGFAGLYRSDHFTNPQPPDEESLECWTSLTWVASHTRRIEFGPLVSPISFREPVMMTRMALALDDLSGGRFQYGLGAGWQVREHAMFGYDLLEVPHRKERFTEAVEVAAGLLRSDTPISFNGQYYHLNDAVLLPRPQRAGGPPIVIGGGRVLLPLVARYGNEWNIGFKPPAEFAKLNARLDELLDQRGRPRSEVRRSMMTGLIFGRDDAQLESMLRESGQNGDELRQRGLLVGTPAMLVEQLGVLAEAGVQRVMVQWGEWDQLDGLEALAKGVLPHLTP